MDEDASKKSLLDKITNLTNKGEQQPTPVDPSTLTNARTQSMVISDRERAGEELKLLAAQREQQAKDAQVQIGVDTAKKTGVYIIVSAICGILIILIVILVFTLIPYFKKSGGSNVGIVTGGGESKKIGFYECLAEECRELTELTDGRTLVYDGNYVILDQENKESFTTVMVGEYDHATAFDWGEKSYVHAVLSTGVGAIFSITDNKYITKNSYEFIYSDIDDDVYANQTWLEGNYIIAMRSGDFRLIDINSGKEMVQGSRGVFATKDGYYVAYDQDGKKRIFNGSNIQVALIESGSVYIRDNLIVVVFDDGNYTVYNDAGETPREYSFNDEISRIDGEQRAASIANDSRYFKIPD